MAYTSEVKKPPIESSWLKTKDVKVDTCCFLARHFVLLEQGKNWLTQGQDNVTEWDIKSWCCRHDLPTLYSCHGCTPSQVGTDPDMTLDGARL